jgi:hypothetical protein
VTLATPTAEDAHGVLRDKLLTTAYGGPGETSAEQRRAVAKRDGVPDDLATLVDKIHDNPFKVLDEDLAESKQHYSEDALFELIVCAALGASQQRYEAGMRTLAAAMEGAQS